MTTTALAQQRQRQQLYLATVREANYPRFSEEGKWSSDTPPPSARERFWHCLALLTGAPHLIARANRVIETSAFDVGDFTAFFALLLRRLHDDKLTPAARAFLDECWQRNIAHVHEHIHRYTENCAALNCFTLLEAGARLGESRHLTRALERLAAFAGHYRHSDVGIEFGSFNYLPVLLNGFAAVAGLARDRRARAIARRLEARAWRELANAWHPLLQHSVGPSARSYTLDSVAGMTSIRALVWLALGDHASVSPMAAGLFDEPPRCLVKNFDPPFTQAEFAWLAAVPYRVPPAAARAFYQKRFPTQRRAAVVLPAWREYEPHHDSRAARELGGWVGGETGFVPSTILHPGGRTLVASYLDKDFGLGTATRTIYSQSDFLFAIWRRTRRAPAPPNIRTLFTRFVVNDALEKKLGPDRYASVLPEQGRGGAWLNGPLAVAWYAGHDAVTTQITQLRTCVLLPTIYRDVDDIVTEGPWTFIRDGVMTIALRPLAAQRVEVKRVGRFLAVCGIHYAGPPKDFHPAALRQVRGGVVGVLGTGDFRAIRTACARAEIEDAVYESQRRLRVPWRNRQIELLWDMQTEELLWAKTDGRFVGARAARTEPDAPAAVMIETGNCFSRGGRGRCEGG